MKIKELYIYNIASLKGKNSIDFDEISNHSKTIAITGETGAGKSSILSSIAIALFGKNHKDNFSQTDLVTLGEEEAEVRLKFSVGIVEYMSVWKCRVRKKNKELLKKPTVTRSLYIYEDDQERELNSTADEVIGLSFEQFTKTIILNQGEFSQFLLSNFSDRKKILESLLSDYDLTKLSVKSKRKLKAIEAKLNVVRSKVDGLKENNLHNKDDILKDLEEVQKILSKTQKEKEEYKHYDSLLEDIIKDVKSFNNSKMKAKESEELISKKHSILNQAQTILNKTKAENEQLTTSSKVKVSELTKIKEMKTILEIDLKQKVHLSELLDKNLNQKNTKEESYSKYETELFKIKDQLKELKDTPQISKDELVDIEINYKKIQEIESKKKNNKEKIKIQNEALSSLKAQILDEKKQESQYTNLISNKADDESLRALKLHHKELVDLKETTLFKLKKNNENITKLKDLGDKKKNLDKEVKTLTKNVKNATKQIEILIQANEANTLKVKLIELTNKSIELEECVICHSTDLSNIEKLQISSEDYTEDLNIEQSKATALTRELDLANSKSTDVESQIKLLQESTSNTDDDNLYKDIQKKIGQTELEIESLSSSLIKQEQYTNELAKTQSRIDQKENEAKKLNEQLNIYITENMSIDSEVASLSKLIRSHLADIFFSDLENILSTIKKVHELNSRLNRGSEIISNIRDDIKELTTSINDLKSKLKDINKKIEDKQDQIPEDLLNQNIEQLIVNVESKLQASNKSLNIALEDVNQVNIETAQEKSKYKMLLEQLSAYEAQFLTKTSSFKKSEISLLAKIKDKLSKISQIDDIDMKLIEKSHSIISEQKQDISNTFISHKEEKSKLELLLEQSLKNERLVSESLKEIKLLQKEEAIAEQLYSILGKDEFRNHVLSLVEKNLIQSTNHQLNQLCQGRYILKQQINKSTASSDYYIIDKLNFSMLRKVSTLSGGETFMVSLAMAIALSELTRGENIIDNFFIDEGFGTLDEDSIEEVLEMLNSIKSQGKTITLISHIKSLTSRIPVNINVQKSESGSSKISTLFQ